MKMLRFLCLGLLGPGLVGAVRADEAATLKDAFKDHFLVGTALNRAIVTGRAGPRREATLVAGDIALVKAQFNQIVAENDMKWALLHPHPGADGYDFTAADALVEFGEAHNMQIAGHTLVWHSQTPNWVFEGTHLPPGVEKAPEADGTEAGRPRRGPGGRFARARPFDLDGPRASREELLERMREHIHTVMGRYKGRIKVWDVVNEAISDGGDEILRKSPWSVIVGPDFINKAFEYAHEADPDAILRYNDYGLENPEKRRKLIALIKALKEQGVPVMAIGSQAHVNVSTGFESMDQCLTEIATLGLPIHITELDVNSAVRGQGGTGADVAGSAGAAEGGLVDDANRKLAEAYEGIFKAFVKHRDSVEMVTFWGANDAVSWRRNGNPLLFDRNNQPKPAFEAVLKVAALGVALVQASDYENTEFQPKSGLPPFEYMKAPAPLPNYTPNAQWGTQGEPIATMQKPLSPEASMRHLVTFPEFDIAMFAAEPEIYKPLWLAFDQRGRAWISETIDYPNELQSPGEGRDRLKILEDTDGDGKADKFTIFADNLSIPTSFLFSNGGVIVTHSGRTEFLKDADGDDRADERRVLFDGWSMRDTHATVSHLRYGFDNWIWGTVGYSGFDGLVAGERIRFGQGIFRFKPDGSKLEFIRSSNNNTWGLGFTEDNIVIGSTANGNASMYMPIPNRYYEAVHGWSAARLESIASSQSIHPITDKVRQVDWHGRYTAGCGGAIYTARSFPREFWNRGQFVAEPTGHLLGMFFLDRQGADFSARNCRNFVASDDEWTSPIYAEVGPDGAVWMADWYNYIIQHNPTPKGFETGRGSAYETPLRDKTHGRIYRITHKQGRASTFAKLDPADPAGLVAALGNDNMFWRMHAQRLLVERGHVDVVPALAAMVRIHSVDELGLNPAAIHALWTMQGLGAMDGTNGGATEAAVAGLTHPSPGVRRAAVMVLPRNESALNALLENHLLGDEDAQVRMAALLALAELPSREDVAAAIANALKEPRNLDDRWIPDAATAAAAKNDTAFLKAMISSAASDRLDPEGALGKIVRVVTRHYAGRSPADSIVSTLTDLKSAAPDVATTVLEGLLDGWPTGAAPSLSAADKQQLESVMEALPELVRDRLLRLGERWSVPGLFTGRMAAIVASLQAQVAAADAEDDARAGAAKRWIALEDKRGVAESILSHITLLSPPTLAEGLIGALGESRNDETGGAIMEHWAAFSPAARRTAIGVLSRRSEWALAMLDAVENKRIARTDIAPEYWSQLRRNRDRRVAGRADRLGNASVGVSADRAAIVERLLPLAEEKGDAPRGKEVFTTTCAVCHKFGGAGGAVGPDLTGIGARPRADILLEILDPNRSVEANFRLWTVTTKDGSSYAGRLEAETQTTVEILDLTAQKHVIQRKEIESLEGMPQSIMPVGYEALPPDDLKALLEYLAQPH